MFNIDGTVFSLAPWSCKAVSYGVTEGVDYPNNPDCVGGTRSGNTCSGGDWGKGAWGRFAYFPNYDVFVWIPSTSAKAWILRLQNVSAN